MIRTSIDDGASLLLNDGNGKFSKAPDSGLLGDTGAMSIALADIDGDEDLDLYITNYKRRSVLDLYSPEEAAFPNTVERTESGLRSRMSSNLTLNLCGRVTEYAAWKKLNLIICI